MSEFKLDQIFATPLMSFDYGKISDDENKFISKCLESTTKTFLTTVLQKHMF